MQLIQQMQTRREQLSQVVSAETNQKTSAKNSFYSRSNPDTTSTVVLAVAIQKTTTKVNRLVEYRNMTTEKYNLYSRSYSENYIKIQLF